MLKNIDGIYAIHKTYIRCLNRCILFRIAEVSSEEDSSKTARVYARNTGYFKDDYHVYYYLEEIKKLVEPLCKEKDYIQKYETEIEGHTTTTEWTGKETLKKYLDKAEYTAILRIYLQEN